MEKNDSETQKKEKKSKRVLATEPSGSLNTLLCTIVFPYLMQGLVPQLDGCNSFCSLYGETSLFIMCIIAFPYLMPDARPRPKILCTAKPACSSSCTISTLNTGMPNFVCATYNVLGEAYAMPSWFPYTSKRDLSWNVRKERIREQVCT